MKGHYHPHPVRRDTVRGLLQGFGADDIAVIWGHAADDVRAVIAGLRAHGMLRSIIRQARTRV